jgi:cysteine desulfurase/selenocysteine lyase
VDGIHVSDIASFLDLENVAVRAGHHCTQPLHTYLGISHTARASCYVYNDEADVDIFVEKLRETIEFFKSTGS